MGVSVVSLTCPVCGAPFSPNDEHCSYCGSILVLRTDHPKINPASLNKQVIDERIAEFRQNLRRDPHDSAAHYGLGVAYFNLRLTDDSVRELEEAARLMPENPNIQSQLAVVLKLAADEGRPGAQAKLRDRIEYTLRLDPDNLDALLLKIESDSALGDREILNLLENMHEVDPDRIGPKLCSALIQMAGSDGIRNTPKEIDFLRRAYELDAERTGDALTASLYRNATNLSDSDPYEDSKTPTRSRQAISAWHELNEFNPDYAEKALGRYLRSLPDLSKADERRLRKLTIDTTGSSEQSIRRQELIDRVAATTENASVSIVKPIIMGVLKAIGVVIVMFIAFAVLSSFLPDNHIILMLLAFAIFSSFLALPIIMPIRAVKKARRETKQQRELESSQPTPQPSQAPAGQSHEFTELLSILRSYFLHRWEQQRQFRIRMADTTGGARAEKERDQRFRSSLTSST